MTEEELIAICQFEAKRAAQLYRHRELIPGEFLSLAWEAAIKACDDYRDDKGASLRTYLHFIIRRRLIDFVRLRTGRRRKRKLPQPTSVTPELQQEIPSEPEMEYRCRELLDELPLPPTERSILQWRCEGMTYREIGDAMGLSESRIYQIIQEIRTLADLSGLRDTVTS